MRLLLAVAAVLTLAAPAQAAKRPDLRVSALAVSGVTAPGAALTATATVRNAGRRAAKASVSRLTVAGIRRDGTTKKIRRGKRRKVGFSVVAPAAGTHALRVCADATRRVRESREKNNCRKTSLVVVAPPLPPTPTPTPEPTASPTPAPAPELSIADVTQEEGGENVFSVALSSPRDADTVIGYGTQGGSASSGMFSNDFVSETGSVTIPAGQTSAPIGISVVDDDRHEADETYLVNLTDPGGVTVADPQAVGTILDNDAFRMTFAVPLSNRWVRAFFNAQPDDDTVDLEAFNFQLTPGDAQTAITEDERVRLQVSPTLAGQTYTLGSTGVEAVETGDVQTADTVTFQGYPNTVLLSEIAPAVTGQDDRIELRTRTATSLNGLTVVDNSGDALITFATLPNINLVEHEVIVIHAEPGTTATTETTSKTQCAVAACYDGAWDVAGGVQIPYSSRIIEIRRNGSQVVDAVPLTRDEPATAPANFATNFNNLLAAYQWEASCPSTCTETQARNQSESWETVGTDLTGNTVRRTGVTDANTTTEWSTGAQSLGSLNP